MNFMKRIFLFMAVNVLVVFTISMVLNLIGVHGYLTARGIDYKALMIFCLVWGFGGAFISLALSRIMAKWMMGVQIIDPETRDPELRSFVATVHRLARGAGLSKMPEVGIYESPELNAFATGPTKSRALVAVSSGLLRRMRADEVEGVLSHEIAHIANGDMVTMTLVQGVINAFVMFLSRVLAYALTSAMRKNDDESPSYFATFAIQMVLEIVFMILGSIVVATFSRYREYRADAGGAKLGGKNKMIAALEALKRNYEMPDDVGAQQPAFQNLKISSKGKGIFHLFSTHPPLDERIARLRELNVSQNF